MCSIHNDTYVLCIRLNRLNLKVYFRHVPRLSARQVCSVRQTLPRDYQITLSQHAQRLRYILKPL